MAGERVIGIDTYAAKKALGLATLQKVGNSYAMTLQRFDPDTGRPVDPDVIAVGIEDLLEAKDSLRRQIEQIEMVLDEIRGLG